MRYFSGNYLNRVDAKGRVSIPAPFRGALETMTDGHIGLRLRDQTIAAYTSKFIDEVMRRLEELPSDSPERHLLAHKYLGSIQQIRPDGEGRIIVPRDMAQQAKIDREAIFVGLGDHFEIWQPEIYQTFSASIVTQTESLTLPSLRSKVER
ncbi:MAG: hypothetical protein AAF442_04830 [Pseudomonadota bacterium]